MPEADEERARRRLRAAAGKARHPALGLWNFVAEAGVLPDDDDLSDESVPDGEREYAEMRRAALVAAATEAVDSCITDLREMSFDHGGRPDADEAPDSFVFRWFPKRHRGAYDEDFFRKVLVIAVQVAADLANPEGGPAACTADEIVRHAVGRMAMELCEKAGLGRPWSHPDEYLLEDTDFEFLYSEQMDGLEDDPGAQAALGIDVPPVGDWFSPFNDSRFVHPYAETDSSAPDVHDLYQRLGEGDDPTVVFAPDVVDDAAPIAGFPAGSGIVALMRQAADPVPGHWVADESDPEQSFAALVAAAAADVGSGWLDWESHEGADSVRSEPVIQLTAHRHFPVGDDEPWVHAASAAGHFLAIPLRYVVSFRPDPEVRARWQQTFNDLLS